MHHAIIIPDFFIRAKNVAKAAQYMINNWEMIASVSPQFSSTSDAEFYNAGMLRCHRKYSFNSPASIFDLINSLARFWKNSLRSTNKESQ